ncbi:hypothetical protein [Parabacteroides sp. AF17-28]|uniref:hypothetical protein n=1 Tax=Parabacteroides sp. AF17-28 TaxID=2292241 RepID=UPI000EFE5324|nr:hypothetical protein [Parabacteroides sp. AF17-28]
MKRCCVITDILEEVDLAKLVSSSNLGIITLDIGRMDAKDSKWLPLERYTSELGIGLHRAISNAFIDKFSKEPIGYLFEHYESNKITSNIIVHSFAVTDRILESVKDSGTLFNLKKDEDTNVDSGIELDITGFCDKYYPVSIDTEQLSPFEKFCSYQQLFTDYVASIYNKIHNSQVVKYVSIVLFAYRYSDGIYHFTHNAAIFSNNLQYLERDITRLMFSYITKSKYLNEVELLRDKTNIAAVKSAKAAIMSRNMSHNLGSHVMFYIKQKLNSVSKMLDSEVLKDLYPDAIESLSKDLKNKEFEMPFLVGMGRFINYLQERQDYIATVATDYIPANSTISFKDFIYDELKPDLRYKRHKENNSSSTETKGHKPKNLLMDFIAYSEGYESSDEICLRFGEFTGKNPEREKQKEDFKKLREFDVALPGGVIGRQAFFSIIENIIRNAAKHSGKRSDNKLAIDLNFIDISKKELFGDELLYDTTIYGGKRVPDLQQKYLDVGDKYFVLAITSNMPNSKESIKNLEKALSCSYLDEEGNMDDKSKGIKEIRISAAWLRGYFIDTEIPEKEPPVIAIRGVKMDGEKDKYAIQYYVCLPKPKRVAFLISKESGFLNIDSFIEKKLKENSCNIFECTNFDKQSDPAEFGDLPDYDIVVCCDKDCSRIIPVLSSRVIKYQEINLKHLKSIISAINQYKKGLESQDSKIKDLDDEIKNRINRTYRLWYEQVYGQNNDKLTVMDNKSEVHKLEADKISVNLKGTSEDNITSFEDAVIFATHYEGMIQEQKKHQDDPRNYSDRSLLFAEACFVEGITGNNSTDRLIRQNGWTEEWKYKHLAAGRTRIAIFDERIFSSISPLVERKRISVSEILDNYLKETVEDEKSIYSLICYFNESSDEFKNRSLADSDRIIIQCQSVGIDFLDIENLTEAKRNNLIQILEENYNKNVHTTNYVLNRTQKYHEMKIWAYDVKCYEERKDDLGKIVQDARVDIIGYNAPITPKIGIFDQANYDVEVIATIRKKKMNYEIELNKMQSNSFDFISIHQGILDKMYATFKVESVQATDKLTIKENQAIEKCKITHTLHRILSRQETPEEVTGYLPQFIIHSGRSKPNTVDMPQKQPFLQFAAIDHAVRDCKYTLSELLFSAHYEKGFNNNTQR